MTLIDIQRRIVEVGRIRIGQQVPTKTGGRRPAKLETFRLTSSDERRIRQAAELYGGTPAEWESPNGKQWEVITERSELEVLVPPSDLSFSQHYELWSAGGCQRRCDGAIESLSGSACLCDPEARECDIHTRLSVLLRELPGLGVWRIDTQGYYAATELAGAVQLITLMAGTNLIAGRLRLDQRSVKRPGKDGKPETRRFAVPVLDVEVTASALLEGNGQGVALPAAIGMTPVPTLPGPTISEQSEPPAPKKRRTPPLPESGRRRGRAAAEPDEAPQDGQDGDEPTEKAVAPSAPARTVEAAGEPAQAPDGESPTEEAPARGRGRRAAASGDAGETDWMKRIHALGNEVGIDHDGLRLIGAALVKVAPVDLAAFSMTELAESTLQGLDKLLRSFEKPITGDIATEWVEKIAGARGLTTWDAIDPLAAAAIASSLDDATPAEWIAFGLRLHAGEYDPQEKETAS